MKQISSASGDHRKVAGQFLREQVRVQERGNCGHAYVYSCTNRINRPPHNDKGRMGRRRRRMSTCVSMGGERHLVYLSQGVGRRRRRVLFFFFVNSSVDWNVNGRGGRRRP